MAGDLIDDISRDFAVARDVRMMAQLRRYEIEFEIYATAYWDDGQRMFLASKDDAVACDAIERLSLEGHYPIPLQIYRERRLVPAGWDDEIEFEVRQNACLTLRQVFLDEYWQHVRAVADGRYNDAGAALLAPWCDELEGTFDEEGLQLFELLLNRLYLRRNITPYTYESYCAWLKDERAEMVDDLVDDDIFFKDMSGFAYRAAGDGRSGAINISINALRKTIEEWVDDAARKGNLVTPVFRKRCWFNYAYQLSDARRDFREQVKRLYDDSFFALLERVDQLPVAVDVDSFMVERARLQALVEAEQTAAYAFDGKAAPNAAGNAFASRITSLDAKDVLRAWESHGRQWGIAI